MDEKLELSANCGRIRSKEDEEALDKKIAEIRKKNQLIEQRKEVVEEDRANFVNEYGKMSLYDRAKGTMYRNKETLKSRKPGEWDREWDAGKISVENWKENVPDIDNSKGTNAHFLRRSKNRSNGCKSNNSATTKKVVEIKEKKEKQEGAKVCTETNKKVCFLQQQQQQQQQKQQQTGGKYRKQSSGLSRKCFSTGRMNSNDVANASIATQHLDTVQVNISMLELKKVLIFEFLFYKDLNSD
ncbi:unnamed protein product [Brugia pahangi]|uniref:Uncharacterized protein n=1 Tax=Brugia pahangi TaxID=6280 RepID=A0A158PS13_BRUPA|nr:unnamed protein product [Brugia pahangi]